MGVVDVDALIVAGVDARVVDERMVMAPAPGVGNAGQAKS